MLVGEAGFDPNPPPDQTFLQGTAESFGIPLIDNYLELRNIGWLAWNFGPQWLPTLCLDWNYTPSVPGAFFRERLLQQ